MKDYKVLYNEQSKNIEKAIELLLQTKKNNTEAQNMNEKQKRIDLLHKKILNRQEES